MLLQRLHMLKQSAEPGKPATYTLTKPFINSLRQALTGGGKHRSFGVPCNTPAKDLISVAQLDEFTRRQWEGVLGYMVGSAEGVVIVDGKHSVSEGVKKLLRDGGLVRSKGRATITTEGFAFVLQEVNQQVWILLIHYLNASVEMNMDPTEVLSFLFTLSSLELGQDYSKANLSPTQLRMLEDLSDFGLVYQRSPQGPSFYPTRLATTLTSSDAGALRSSTATAFAPGVQPAALTADNTEPESGFIVIETNYRIYAYTTSSLQIAILQLFTRLSTRYPNMVAGKITRASIRRAVALGITSEQIIAFLGAHAHPQMRKNASTGGGGGPSDATVLPPTVVDQIRLWQIEGERMKASPGYLFKDFANSQEFETCCTYASEIGVLVWSSADQRMFFVNNMEQIAPFVRSRTKKSA